MSEENINDVEENGYYWKGEPTVIPGNIEYLKKPIVVELFCGCGGTSLGFEMAGYDIALGLDLHGPSIATFKRNHPNAIAVLGDVKKMTPQKIKELLGGRKIDVLIAGVPCQGFSLNNRKRYTGDKRNQLYKEYIKYLEYLKPNIAMIENVSGMISTKNGEFVKNIESEIARAGGMKSTSRLLNAADYGVPQLRKRLVFIGVKGEKEFSFDKDMKKTNGPDTDKPYVTVGEALSDLPSLNANEQKTLYKSEPSNGYQKLMRKSSKKNLSNHQAPNHPVDTIKKIKETKPGEPMYEKYKQRIRLSNNAPSPTQVCGGIRPQFQFGHPDDSRGLSIRERCRIQSFPDSFEIVGGIVQGRVQTGNAVPPLLAKAIALGLKKYLKGEKNV